MQIRSRKYGLLTKKKSLGSRRGPGANEKAGSWRVAPVTKKAQTDALFNQKKAKKQLLAEFSVSSQPGNEIEAMQQVVKAVRELPISRRMLERMKTAVAETVMNAMEHGNHFRAELPVNVRVETHPRGLSIQVTDRGGDQEIPEADLPDLEAKMAGLQSSRGWGLFLIKSMTDEIRVQREGVDHMVTLIFYLPEEA